MLKIQNLSMNSLSELISINSFFQHDYRECLEYLDLPVIAN